ncbi:hypothetical protein [Microbulbifer variabilis]|uniref:hypothetical protein n=1 Tax=Microbulbifer variabilis TaxID=266805 RepID=UPI001CFD3E25|nr:hypothetical protein [Microbulbifer variabilis]
MKYILTMMIGLVLAGPVAATTNILDLYFNTADNGGTLRYDDIFSYGKSGNGSDFDMCDSYSSKRVSGDKIAAITSYSGDEHIKGLKLEYLYADDDEVGKTTGSGFRKLLGDMEYIQGWRFYKKRDGNISRIRVYLKDMSNNTTREITFGSNNSWNKWQEYQLSIDTRSVVGFAGTAGDSKIWSIYPCVADRFDLIESGMEIHWDQIVETPENTKTFFGERLLENVSDVTQSDSTEVWYTDGKSETDTWTNTLGISVTAGVSLTEGYKVGVPSTVENSGSVTFSFSETFSASTTVGETSTVSNQRTVKEAMPASVPAYSLLVARMMVENSEVEIPYTSTVTNPHNGDEFQLTGVIKGSSYSKSRKRWDVVGNAYPDHYEVFESYSWVVEYYGLENVTIIEDPVIN